MSAKNRLPPDELAAYADRIAALPRFDLSPAEAAPLLGSDGYSLNIAAKEGGLGSIDLFCWPKPALEQGQRTPIYWLRTERMVTNEEAAQGDDDGGGGGIVGSNLFFAVCPDLQHMADSVRH